MSRVLIAGCGYVGAVLGVELAAAGDQVYGLRRDPSSLPAAIAPVAADLADPATLAGLPEVDAVVYAAAANGFSADAYRATYFTGLANLLAASTPRRLIFVSSTAVYAQQDGSWVDEESPTQSTHWSARALLAGESLALDGAPESIVLRLGGIYGPGRTRLVDQVRSGQATWAGDGPRYTNRIHRDDAAGALAHLLRLAGPARIYLGVDDDPADRRVVLEWLAAAYGAPPPRPAAAAEASRRELSNKRCSNARLRDSGYDFRYPTFRDGYGALRIGAGG